MLRYFSSIVFRLANVQKHFSFIDTERNLLLKFQDESFMRIAAIRQTNDNNLFYNMEASTSSMETP